MSTDHHIPRPFKAEKVAGLLNPDPLVGESAGLLLAAPRRTGKKHFSAPRPRPAFGAARQMRALCGPLGRPQL